MLKENLAEKYILNTRPDLKSWNFNGDIEAVYIAGFEAARKLVLRLMKDSEDGDWDFLKYQVKVLGEEKNA